MAAVYTKFSLDDIERFLKRGWRAMRPRKGVQREIFYDLSLGPNVFIRVWSSIYPNETLVRGKERRPMRVQLLAGRLGGKGQPLTGKKRAPTVKRTQNWRGTLQKRIEDYIEQYTDDESKFEWIGGKRKEEEAAEEAAPTPKPTTRPPATTPARRSGIPYATQPQINYIQGLRRRASQEDWEGLAERYDLSDSPTDEELESVSKSDASRIIGALKDMQGSGRRWSSGEEDPAYTYNRQGEMSARLQEVEPGYWADPEVRWTIERTATTGLSGQETFRVADMHGDWRDEASSLDDAVKKLSDRSGGPMTV